SRLADRPPDHPGERLTSLVGRGVSHGGSLPPSGQGRLATYGEAMELGVLGELGDVERLGARLASVEGRLHDTVAVDGPSLAPASRRMTRAGGKRLRPALVIAAAECGGAFDERVTAAAVAVELVQAGSLVHDDLFDGASTRRGVPTI